MSTILNYCNPIQTDHNLMLSIDNIVLDLYISAPEARDKLMQLLNMLPVKYAAAVTHWDSFKVGTFREQFSIKMQDGTSFWLGAGLNGRKTEWGRCRLDFNPNKISQHIAFQVLLRYLIESTRPMHRKIKRFDLAVDIPVQRQDVFLVKDSRAYLERRHGQEWTQYLGAKSSTVGRVKLYNKQIEAKLNHPLTRLELTLNPEDAYEKISFPLVYFLDDLQICFDDVLKVTETENFILGALLLGYGSLSQLGRKTRAKIESLLNQYVCKVEISQKDYAAILAQLRAYTQGRVQTEGTDNDQPPLPLPDWVLDAKTHAHEAIPLQNLQER